MVLKGRDARSGFAGRISDVLRSEDKASLTPLDIYGAIASGYIIGNGVYMLSDLLRGKRGIRAPEKVETDDYAPFTSVIIPIYNEPIEVVKATLASMSKLEYPEYEIIIADDSSPSALLLRKVATPSLSQMAPQSLTITKLPNH
ncbi:glycosyltransferase family 2 protein [Candidatus Marsarchaeota archaeon]|nr:glycosyltransferase family 2 protein [Candidatus Marsarchaeota archaeon]